VLSLTSVTQIPENIAQLKVIVYKSRVDAVTLKQKAEEMKNELFIKRFSKPKTEDIHVVSVDKHYEPYILVDAKYRIEYYAKKTYSIEVNEQIEEVKILGESFKPQPEPIPGSEPKQFHNVISLEGQELFSNEDKVYLILDKNGKEISPDQVPIAPSEESPKKILRQFKKNTEKTSVSTQEVIELAKSRLIRRPADMGSINNELFQVTEHAIIYSPVYKITFRNIKTKEEKSVSIDGITAEIIK
jgi:hypothetical protein